MTKYFDYSSVINLDITPTPSYTLGSRTLKKGMKGDDVKELQQVLIKLGYQLPKYGADGDYGTETINAVKEFQTKNKLTVDGIFGPKSYNVLKS